MTAWGKLFKKKLFNHVRFSENKLAEDAFIMYKLFLQCEKMIWNLRKLPDVLGKMYILLNIIQLNKMIK